ncbi:hypothetical protein BDK51DRAFT_28568 [Blyttiomyces helicus]|uniref:Uncharacterized protein n=1 Tax=Blyttiomyces helicus TaxID=388810 RepID=A0A4P9WPP2_9FUNG|nr:hypothetical protein BDK51DRAFT_28568 [Blyttiomyces helicus]|eukprot:RKO93230.1 hypothetical protein BDK51DRAFT_28568 [Blyttiomyces helicus]
MGTQTKWSAAEEEDPSTNELKRRRGQRGPKTQLYRSLSSSKPPEDYGRGCPSSHADCIAQKQSPMNATETRSPTAKAALLVRPAVQLCWSSHRGIIILRGRGDGSIGKVGTREKRRIGAGSEDIWLFEAAKKRGNRWTRDPLRPLLVRPSPPPEPTSRIEGSMIMGAGGRGKVVEYFVHQRI